ncbi:hypothetical protein WR25_02338 [Diploscapter pachys]|uniref:RING-type E3 ubiquitin transferase n=1 Tax=Diploscapter pachys TaxID=2018661 RepID=A0A2A2K146_9BILA|nr:hypothetical protein WR25_02338 [Diploscapter pachys]
MESEGHHQERDEKNSNSGDKPDQSKKPGKSYNKSVNNNRRTQGSNRNNSSRNQGGSYRGSGRRTVINHSVDMNKYKKMISAAEDNFSDIKRGEITKECDICCKANDVFAVGACRHPICVECALRIRILQQSNQCPVCRGEVETLYFVEASNDLAAIPLIFPLTSHPDEERYKVRFENAKAGTTYEKYLSHVCKICVGDDGERKEFPKFMSLRQHMASQHGQSYCHICTENLNLFSRERKTYGRDELLRHIKDGDRDDQSLKGHPRCLFCDERFFDDEARYRHLRKHHYFCQFCEAEGTFMNMFFGKHEELVKHYGDRHFLCESETCKAMGIAFPTKMDLALHRTTAHRETNNLLDFQFSDRDRRQNVSRGNDRGRPPSPQTSSAARPAGGSQRIVVVPAPAQPAVPTSDPSEFVVVPSAQSKQGKSSVKNKMNVAPAYQPQAVDFPGLPSNGPPGLPAPQIVKPNDFPRLPKSKPQIASNSRPTSSNSASGSIGPPPGFTAVQTPNDFPRLPKSTPVAAQPSAFVPPKKVTPAKLPAKQTPVAARPPPAQRQMEDDFPSLSIAPSTSRNSATALASIAPPTTEAVANKIKIAPKPVAQAQPIQPQSVPKASDFPDLSSAPRQAASRMPSGWGAKKPKGRSVITGCIVPRGK